MPPGFTFKDSRVAGADVPCPVVNVTVILVVHILQALHGVLFRLMVVQWSTALELFNGQQHYNSLMVEDTGLVNSSNSCSQRVTQAEPLSCCHHGMYFLVRCESIV